VAAGIVAVPFFVLGWLASEQPKSIEWLPGDELEAARKARPTQ
jgi:hypothetical protein